MPLQGPLDKNWLMSVLLNLSQVAPIGPFWLQRVLSYFWGELGRQTQKVVNPFPDLETGD